MIHEYPIINIIFGLIFDKEIEVLLIYFVNVHAWQDMGITFFEDMHTHRQALLWLYQLVINCNDKRQSLYAIGYDVSLVIVYLHHGFMVDWLALHLEFGGVCI